jgi:hypothetical protein
MAYEIRGPLGSGFATIRADGGSIPISFPLDTNGFALVSAARLGLRFHLNVDSLHIDEEVLDFATTEVTHTIGQVPECNGDGKYWLLRCGRFIVYGLGESTRVASTEFAPFLRSPSLSSLPPKLSIVKEEPGMQSVTILSDDSDANSPQEPRRGISNSGNPPSDAPHAFPARSTPTVVRPLESQTTIFDCLKRLRFTKGTRNALKKIDYDSVEHLRVDYLPPVFNGDIVF